MGAFNLLLSGSTFLKKKHKISQFKIFLPQFSKQEESYYSTRKIFQDFERHDH